jgi:catechol 2,3-dioxygenase-like lactoylglutathione lyase family enzyme
MRWVAAAMLACLVGGCGSAPPASPGSESGEGMMQLGNFSVSLAVKDLGASRAFYEALGFRAVGGEPAQGWLILQNETTTIGLFQGMFEKNMLTFNPGWDRDKNTLVDFADVREIQRALKARGLVLTLEADEATTGPGSVMLTDPDGNPVLIDQHVASPKK